MSLKDLEKKLYKQKEFAQEKSSEVAKEVNAEKLGSSYQSGWQSSVSGENTAGNFFSRISSVAKWIFFTMILILVVAGGVSGYYLYQYLTADKEISFSVSSAQDVMIGKPFDLTLNFSNNSKNILKDAEYSFVFPDGVSLVGDSENKRIFNKKIGDLDPGSIFQEKVGVIILGQDQSVKKISASFVYSSSLKARFEKKQDVEITAQAPAISLDLTAPEKVLSSEEFETKIHYANVSGVDFSGVNIKLIYPQNFNIKELSPKNKMIDSSGNINLNTLKKGEQGDISVIAKVIGQNQSFFELKAQLFASFSGQNYEISEKSANLNIVGSPLYLGISVNNSSSSYVSYPNDMLQYHLSYVNNTDVSLSDVVIMAKLSGEMFDFQTLKTSGSFDSKNNILTWNASNISDLRSLAPRQSGSVDFNVMVKPDYPIKRLYDKNFSLKINAEISSPTVPYYVAAEKTVGVSSLETKVSGKITIEPTVYFNDPVYGASKGSLPPRANKLTDFIIHWIIKNYSSDMDNIEINSALEPGISFVKIIKSNIDALPVYNDRTQTLSWSIPKIYAAKGVIGKPVEVVFQIEALPNITQIGREMPLLAPISLTATDDYTGATVNYSADILTTRSLSDFGISEANKQVIQ